MTMNNSRDSKSYWPLTARAVLLAWKIQGGGGVFITFLGRNWWIATWEIYRVSLFAVIYLDPWMDWGSLRTEHIARRLGQVHKPGPFQPESGKPVNWPLTSPPPSYNRLTCSNHGKHTGSFLIHKESFLLIKLTEEFQESNMNLS